MKLLLTVMAIVATSLLSTINAQKGFGIFAGVNPQKIRGKDANGDRYEDVNLKAGFHAGLNYEFHLTGPLYLQPGILFSTKGASMSDIAADVKGKFSVSYLEFPINGVIKIPVTNQHRFFFGGGPYFGYALGGRLSATNSGITLKTAIEFVKSININNVDDNRLYMKRTDAGFNILGGIELGNHLSVQLDGQLGLKEINPGVTGLTAVDKSTVKNMGFGLSCTLRM